MKLILYKAPGSIWDKGIRVVSGSMYSHAELIIAGNIYSSMYGVGVRKKAAVLKLEDWHSFECIQSGRKALDVFEKEQGSEYDTFGALRHACRLFREHPEKYTCWEICAEMLGMARPWKATPEMLISFAKEGVDGTI